MLSCTPTRTVLNPRVLPQESICGPDGRSRVDLVLSCVDNYEARITINQVGGNGERVRGGRGSITINQVWMEGGGDTGGGIMNVCIYVCVWGGGIGAEIWVMEMLQKRTPLLSLSYINRCAWS